MKVKPTNKTVFSKPTEPMRRIPKSKWDEADGLPDPAFEKINADGWLRLCEILREAQQDERITASCGASDFLELVCELAADSSKHENAIQALRPLANVLAGELLRDNEGRYKGGDTMKQRKDAHLDDLRNAVVDILKNPATSDWSDPRIARWLMERAFHEFQGRTLKEKSMTTRVKEIRAAYKALI